MGRRMKCKPTRQTVKQTMENLETATNEIKQIVSFLSQNAVDADELKVIKTRLEMFISVVKASESVLKTDLDMIRSFQALETLRLQDKMIRKADKEGTPLNIIIGRDVQ